MTFTSGIKCYKIEEFSDRPKKKTCDFWVKHGAYIRYNIGI